LYKTRKLCCRRETARESDENVSRSVYFYVLLTYALASLRQSWLNDVYNDSGSVINFRVAWKVELKQ